MDTNLVIIIAAAMIACILITIYRKTRGNKTIATITQKQTDLKSSLTTIQENEANCNFAIISDNGVKIIESNEIGIIPAHAHRIESSRGAINRVQHMAADLFKGAASISNKTVEIIFKPEIHQGLADGTYTLMKTRSGEVLADAVNSSGTIVGKGRIIQGGKARQLASGAFQLVSIAVAQSHLADIEQSLGTIKDAISELMERQENEDVARISGAFDYLREISTHMRDLRCPDELSQQKRNVIEDIIKESYQWRNKLEEDMSSLINKISSLENLDTFGTGDTFEKLQSLIEKAPPLLKRRRLLLNLASAINFVTAYLDPAQREFSKIDANSAQWETLINKFRDAVLERESALLKKSFWNSNETLQLRKDKLKSLSSDHQRTAADQQIAYLTMQNSLEQSVSRLIDKSGNVRVAISFDSTGIVNGAAVI